MTTQVCKQCGRELDLVHGFYAHPSYATGRMKICKKCKRQNSAEDRALKVEHYRAVTRIRNARPSNVARRKAYAQTERGREVHRTTCRIYMRFKRMEARA